MDKQDKLIDLVDSPLATPTKKVESMRLTRSKTTVMQESGEKAKPISSVSNQRKRVQAKGKRKFVDESEDERSSATDSEEDDNILVTPNIPPPTQHIRHPKTGAVYENVTHKVYERSKSDDLDWYGWTVPTAQHSKFMAPNETFVVFSRREGFMDRYSYNTNPGEFARIGFYKKVVDPKTKK